MNPKYAVLSWRDKSKFPFEELPKLAAESCKEEFKDLSETWRNLDTKAQGLGALAGIFIAAVVSWAKDPLGHFNTLQVFLLLGSTLFLVATVFAAVLALQVKMVTATPQGKRTAKMVEAILNSDDKRNETARVMALHRDIAKEWGKANGDMNKHLVLKANYIAEGQLTLLIAATLAATLAVWTILIRGV